METDGGQNGISILSASGMVSEDSGAFGRAMQNALQNQETAQIMSGQVKTWDAIEGLTGHWNMPCTFRLARAAAMW